MQPGPPRAQRPSLSLWLAVAALAVHDLEESATIGPFLEAQRARLPAPFHNMTQGRFSGEAAAVTACVAVVTWFAVRGPLRGRWLVLACAIQTSVGAHVLQHVAIALWSDGYAPGLVTAILLCLPCAALVLVRAVREEWVHRRQLVRASLAAVILLPPFLLGVHLLAGRIRGLGPGPR